MPKQITIEAKTVREAIKKGLKKLDLIRDQAEVNIIEEGKSGFLGIGSKSAKVIISQKKWSAEKEDRKTFKFKKTGKPQQRFSRQNKFDKKSTKIQPVKTEYKKFAPVPEDLKKNAQMAKDTLSKILSYFGETDTEIKMSWDEVQKRLIARFKCRKPEMIIGREGRTLQAIQYLITLIMARKTNKEIPLQADTEDYWRKFEERIIQSAE
jgi:spoIIIJ-associated protein